MENPNPADLDNDGHDDTNGQFAEGNTEAHVALTDDDTPEAEAQLLIAVSALLEAAQAYASIPSTPQFVLLNGYRLQFAGHDLMTMTVN